MDIPFDTAQQLAELSGTVLSATDLDEALTAVAMMGVGVVPGCDGVSVTMREKSIPTASSADADWSRQLDRLQVEQQEGPCLDCLREGSVMRVRDLAGDGRFPSYGPRAAALGAASALSIPLSADGRTVGALNFYSRQPDAFDTDAIALGTLLSAHASLALQAANAYFSSRRLAGQLQEALASRAAIEQAKGVLMAQRGIGPDDAFSALVQMSQRTNRKLRDVAKAIVEDPSSAQD
ncbi:MAG: GAF and ANTAR domain-containing protein [Actinomycetes bacterium]